MFNKTKLNNLYIQKKSVNELIKKVQYEYFKTKKMSEMEYSVKLKTFNDMLRDIDRQIPEINEQLAKVNKEKEEKIALKSASSNKSAVKSKVYKRGKSR